MTTPRGLSLITTLLILCGAMTPALAANAHYALTDFYGYIQLENGDRQRTEFISKLSRRHFLIGITWSDATERQRKQSRLQALAQAPEATLTRVERTIPGPSGEQFTSYVSTLR